MATIKIKGTNDKIKKFLETNRLYIKRNGLIVEEDIVNVKDTDYKPEPILNVGKPFEIKKEVKKQNKK